jgi:hypothetical protein
MDFFSNYDYNSTHQIKFKNNLNKISILKIFILFKESIINKLDMSKNNRVYSCL